VRVEQWREVVASPRSPGKTDRMREQDAQPVVVDRLDGSAVRELVTKHDRTRLRTRAPAGMVGRAGAGRHGDRVARRLEREGRTRTRLDAAVQQLAGRI
jgi:hypothetical protein